jgi:hypothetical protein
VSLFIDPMPSLDPVDLGDEIWRRWRAHPRARLELSADARTVSREFGRLLARDPGWTLNGLAGYGCAAIEGTEDPVERSRLAQQLASIAHKLMEPLRPPVESKPPSDLMPYLFDGDEELHPRERSAWDQIPEPLLTAVIFALIGIITLGVMALSITTNP